jgi:hypothetical protein
MKKSVTQNGTAKTNLMIISFIKRYPVQTLVFSLLSPFMVLGLTHISEKPSQPMPMSFQALRVQEQFSNLSENDQSQIIAQWNEEHPVDNDYEGPQDESDRP